MPRLQPLNPNKAEGKAKELLDQVQSKIGMVPNLMRTLAQAPAVLQGYLGFSGALAGGSLSPKLREQISLSVAAQNRCDYCLAAHTAIGSKLGLTEDQIQASRRGQSLDPKEDAALQFASLLVAKRGHVNDLDVAKLKVAGYSEEEIIEIVANVAKDIFTNYFNHVADPEVDFPKIPALTQQPFS